MSNSFAVPRGQIMQSRFELKSREKLLFPIFAVAKTLKILASTIAQSYLL